MFMAMYIKCTAELLVVCQESRTHTNRQSYLNQITRLEYLRQSFFQLIHDGVDEKLVVELDALAIYQSCQEKLGTTKLVQNCIFNQWRYLCNFLLVLTKHSFLILTSTNSFLAKEASEKLPFGHKYEISFPEG